MMSLLVESQKLSTVWQLQGLEEDDANEREESTVVQDEQFSKSELQGI